jgi:hypothetical protein
MSTEKPKKIWGAIINMGGGILTPKPMKFVFQGDGDVSVGWYNEKNDFCIDELGFYSSVSGGWASFSSTDKNEVKLFILGAKTFIDVVLKHVVK